MELIRYISEAEYQALMTQGEVRPQKQFKAWDGRNKIHTFPRHTYTDQDFSDVAKYLNRVFNLEYKYRIIIDTGYEEYITFAAYDTEAVDSIIGYKLDFSIDGWAYDTGPVYVVPEVRLSYYTIDLVKEIIKI